MSDSRWQHAKDLFEKALTIPEDERESFLRSQQATTELEVLELVREMLAADSQSGGFLRSPSEFYPSSGPDSASFVGATFNGLEIKSKLGSGGMGVVYLAKDTALECLVAVKFLPRHATLDANAVRRFRREAQRVAQLRHPSIVAIHRLDTLDVCPYFVMDYVNGHDLAQEILVQRGEAPTFSPILP
jgi:hypothetical protein